MFQYFHREICLKIRSKYTVFDNNHAVSQIDEPIKSNLVFKKSPNRRPPSKIYTIFI